MIRRAGGGRRPDLSPRGGGQGDEWREKVTAVSERSPIHWDSRDPGPIGLAAAGVLFSRANGTLGVQAAVLEDGPRGLRTVSACAFDRRMWLREPYRYPEWTYGQAAANERLMMLPYPLALDLRATAGGPKPRLVRQRLWLEGIWSRSEAEIAVGDARLLLARRFMVAEDGEAAVVEELALTLVAGSGVLALMLACGLLAPSFARSLPADEPDPRRPDPAGPDFALLAVTRERTGFSSLWKGREGRRLAIACGVRLSGVEETARDGASWRLRSGPRGCVLAGRLRLTPGACWRAVRRVRIACEDAKRSDPRPSPLPVDIATGADPALAAFDEAAELSLAGDERQTAALAFNLAQLRAQAPRRRASVAAKGLTGAGYAGHVFWDADVYILPVYAALSPALARRMLDWRIAQLPAAQARARELDLPGALYPWRTISGAECSAYFPAGTAQVHLNAGIAYACELLWRMTGDDDLLVAALPMLIETARLWPAIGHFAADGAFDIPCVTGPDEYSALVDNNTYTNVMAAAHLRFLERALARLAARAPDTCARLARKQGLSDEERALFARIARSVRLPRLASEDIPAQDGCFAHRRPWPATRTGRPLLLHYHPLEIYRHRIIKQADLLLAMALRRAAFSADEMARAYRFYAPLTTHDSSLSPAPHAILASWIGDWEEAKTHFAHTLFVDLADEHGNTADGLHLAALAGGWRVLAEGFAGFDPLAPDLTFAPRKPPWLAGYRFRLRWRGRLIAVAVEEDAARYALLAGEPLVLRHHGRQRRLAESPVVMPLPGGSGPRR